MNDVPLRRRPSAFASRATRLALGALFGLLLGAGVPRGVRAEPGAVCGPSHPVSAREIELRIFGATWCGPCQMTERFLASIGATEAARVTIAGREVELRLRHLDIDHIGADERAAMRGEGIPEVQLLVRGAVLSSQSGAITTRAELERFVSEGLSTHGCRVAADPPARPAPRRGRGTRAR